MTMEEEFSRPVKVEEITSRPLARTFEATADERRKLAERFNILDVPRLVVAISLRRQPGDIVALEGCVEAEVVQACVITLQPVPAHVSTAFTVRYLPPKLWAEAEMGREEDIEAVAAAEDVEAMPEDTIDVGEVAAQYLSLALDPYPKASSAAVGSPDSGTEEPGPSQPNPFAVLKNLKERG